MSKSEIYGNLSPADRKKYIALLRGGLPPLYACVVSLTVVLWDYFVTLRDEIKFIWPQRSSTGKNMFLFIRYYTISLLLFDVAQIHSFQIPGVTSDTVCVAMDSIIRIVGAITLWAVEIIMQLRIYALYKCSMKVAIFNGALFLASIAGWMYILIFNAERRRSVIADSIHLNAPGCPSIHTGIEWAQWVPATAFEGVLFLFALYKSIKTAAFRVKKSRTIRVSLSNLVLRDNLLYFLAISILLVINNLMVVGTTKIPWFSYGPFHAATGILTCRMLINVRKASAQQMSGPTTTDIEMMGSSPNTRYTSSTMQTSSTKQQRSALVFKPQEKPTDFSQGTGDDSFASESSGRVKGRGTEFTYQ